MGRGGLQFILIIWLQGIWLPEHGYAFSQTPLWAGIYMLPLIAGLLVAAPASGWLSDRFGARPFATGGMVVAASSFLLLIVLPVDFAYIWFALILLLNGIGMGLFSSPNSAGVMNSLPPSAARRRRRDARDVHELAPAVLSIGVFFSLMIVGLASGLPHTLQTRARRPRRAARRTRRGSRTCRRSRRCSRRSSATTRSRRCSARTMLCHLPAGQAQELTGRSFFPHLIAGPFHTALVYAFGFAIVACLVAAVASLLRGGKYHHVEGRGAVPVRPKLVRARGGRVTVRARRSATSGSARWPSRSASRRGRSATTRSSACSARGRSARRAPTASTARPTSSGCEELIRLRDLLGLSLEELDRARRGGRGSRGAAGRVGRDDERRRARPDRRRGDPARRAPARARPGTRREARRVRPRARGEARAPARGAAQAFLERALR